jgi:hypothetical protein
MQWQKKRTLVETMSEKTECSWQMKSKATSPKEIVGLNKTKN